MICPLSVITTKIFARELLWAVMQRKMFFYIFHQKQIQCWLLVSPHSLILLTDNIMLNLFKRVVLGKKKIYEYIYIYIFKCLFSLTRSPSVSSCSSVVSYSFPPFCPCLILLFATPFLILHHSLMSK